MVFKNKILKDSSSKNLVSKLNNFLLIFFILGISLILACSNNIYGTYFLNLTNDNGINTNYYSFNSPDIYLKTNINNSYYNITYKLVNQTKIISRNLTKCGSYFCGKFTINDIVVVKNNSFYGSLNVFISLKNITKEIYFDIVNPQLKFRINKNKNIVNFTINTTDYESGLNYFKVYLNNNLNKTLYFNNKNIFTKDNLNKRIYINKELALVISNISFNSKNYVKECKFNLIYNLSYGNYNFTFISSDLADNLIGKNYNIFINDFIPPSIIVNYLEKKNNLLLINLTLLDNFKLNYFIIKEGNILIQNNLSSYNKSKITELVSIPFNNSFSIVAFDENMNKRVYNISFENFSINLGDSYSNSKIIYIKTSANKCFLTGINLELSKKIINLNKENSYFIYNLNTNKTGNYTLLGYCEKNKFIEPFKFTYFLDLDKPKAINFTIIKEKDGSLLISWNKSYDKESKVIYKLFKNDKLIYSGTELNYRDTNVIYPNSYTYFIEVDDKAGNIYRTANKTIIPKDVIAVLKLYNSNYTLLTPDNLSIKLFVEKNSILYIKVYDLIKKNSLLLLKNYTYFTEDSNDFIFYYKPKVSNSVVIFKLIDSHNNIATKKVFIKLHLFNNNIVNNTKDLTKQVLKNSINNINESNEVNTFNTSRINSNTKNFNKNLSKTSNFKNKSSEFSLFYLLLYVFGIALLFVVLILFLKLNEKRNISKAIKNYKFSKEIEKIKKKREEMIQRKEEEKKKLEKLKRRGVLTKDKKYESKYHKTLISDLTKNRNFTNTELNRELKKKIKRDNSKKKRFNLEFLLNFFNKNNKGGNNLTNEENKTSVESSNFKEDKKEINYNFYNKTNIKNNKKDVSSKLSLFSEDYFLKHRKGWSNINEYHFKDVKVNTIKNRENNLKTKTEEPLKKETLETEVEEKDSNFENEKSNIKKIRRTDYINSILFNSKKDKSSKHRKTAYSKFLKEKEVERELKEDEY